MANFETIKIEKGMYANKGKSLTDILEELDPSTKIIRELLLRAWTLSATVEAF